MIRFSTSTSTRSVLAIVAAGAVALTSVSAQARDRPDRGGIGAGEIIAGALIIGGIAAAVSAAGRDRSSTHRGDYPGNSHYRAADGPRDAIEQCVHAAERTASRHSYGGHAKVTDIRNIDRKRDGYKVKGRIAVNQNARSWRAGDARYGRGWQNDYRGWNDRYSGYDSGRFTCDVRFGRVADLSYSGIRGLR